MSYEPRDQITWTKYEDFNYFKFKVFYSNNVFYVHGEMFVIKILILFNIDFFSVQ